MVQTVQLDENKHAVAMFRGLKQSQHDGEHCDFIIKVQGQAFHAHKIVLSLRSPYFKAMLKHDTKEVHEGKVEMQDVDIECVKACIDFMYTACFDIPDGKIRDLLHVAIMMQLDDVKEAICSILKESLNAENFYETRNIVDLYDLCSVAEECRQFHEVNFLKLSHQPGFMNEKKCDLISILKSKKFREEQELSLSLRWVGENTERKKNIGQLIKLINLEEISSEYLSNLLENHPVISNDLGLFKLLNAPLMERAKTGTTKREDAKRIVLFDMDADCLKSYNPATDEVEIFHNDEMEDLGYSTTVSMDPYIYAICRKSAWRLNFRSKSSKWKRMQDMIGDHGRYPSIACLLGSLFVIGNSGIASKFAEKFDPDVNQWFKLQDKPDGISSTTLVSLDNSIYCIGGRNNDKTMSAFCKFTPLTSEWANLAPMKIAREDCAAAVVDRRIFVMGGWDHRDECLKEVECYDVASEQWTFLAPMIQGHAIFNAHHINGGIFILNRENIEKYNITSNNWQRVNIVTNGSFDACWSISIPSF